MNFDLMKTTKNRYFHCVITALLILLSISACDTPSDNSTHKSLVTDVSVVDARGVTVSLTKPAQRIIALAPHITENVYSAGAGERLVAVVDFSDYPEAATKLPIVGGYKKLNLERIIELQPDLIIAWESGNSHNSYTRLLELGFTVYVDQPNTLRDVAKSIIDIGILSGSEDAARRSASEYLDKLTVIDNKYKTKSKENVFYQVWNQPLRTIN